MTDVTSLAAINEPMGIAFLYGGSMTGGAVIVPYVYKDRVPYVAALRQMRPLQSSDAVLEFPRGQANLGESGIDTARRELQEETGLDEDYVIFVSHLGSGNPDNALVLGENVQFFAVEIMDTCVDWEAMKLKAEIFRPDTNSRLSEQIKGSEIMPADAFNSSSMMSMAAMGFWRILNPS